MTSETTPHDNVLPFGQIYHLWKDIDQFVKSIIRQHPEHDKSTWYNDWISIHKLVATPGLLPKIGLTLITNTATPTLDDAIQEIEVMIPYLATHL